jgi:hypothetical protein
VPIGNCHDFRKTTVNVTSYQRFQHWCRHHKSHQSPLPGANAQAHWCSYARCLIVQIPTRGPYSFPTPPLVPLGRDLVIRRPRFDLLIGRCWMTIPHRVPQSSHPSGRLAVIFKTLLGRPINHLSLRCALLSSSFSQLGTAVAAACSPPFRRRGMLFSPCGFGSFSVFRRFGLSLFSVCLGLLLTWRFLCFREGSWRCAPIELTDCGHRRWVVHSFITVGTNFQEPMSSSYDSSCESVVIFILFISYFWSSDICHGCSRVGVRRNFLGLTFRGHR